MVVAEPVGLRGKLKVRMQLLTPWTVGIALTKASGIYP